MNKICSASFFPQLSGKTFVRLVEAQIVYKHFNNVIPLYKDKDSAYTVKFLGNETIEAAVQADINHHLPLIFESNYNNTLDYLFEHGLYRAPMNLKEHSEIEQFIETIKSKAG